MGQTWRIGDSGQGPDQSRNREPDQIKADQPWSWTAALHTVTLVSLWYWQSTIIWLRDSNIDQKKQRMSAFIVQMFRLCVWFVFWARIKIEDVNKWSWVVAVKHFRDGCFSCYLQTTDAGRSNNSRDLNRLNGSPTQRNATQFYHLTNSWCFSSLSKEVPFLRVSLVVENLQTSTKLQAFQQLQLHVFAIMVRTKYRVFFQINTR